MNDIQNKIINQWIQKQIEMKISVPMMYDGIWMLIKSASQYNKWDSPTAENVLVTMFGHEWTNEVLTAALDLKPEPEPN